MIKHIQCEFPDLHASQSMQHYMLQFQRHTQRIAGFAQNNAVTREVKARRPRLHLRHSPAQRLSPGCARRGENMAFAVISA